MVTSIEYADQTDEIFSARRFRISQTANAGAVYIDTRFRHIIQKSWTLPQVAADGLNSSLRAGRRCRRRSRKAAELIKAAKVPAGSCLVGHRRANARAAGEGEKVKALQASQGCR